MRRLMFALGLLTSATVLMLPVAAGAQTGSLTFDPTTVTAGGGKLFINGTTGCDPNTTATIFSQAFAAQPGVGDFAGVPALSIEISDTGTFGIGLTIDPSVRSGQYSVSVRCGGGLAASGTLTVIGLPTTGAPVATLRDRRRCPSCRRRDDRVVWAARAIASRSGRFVRRRARCCCYGAGAASPVPPTTHSGSVSRPALSVVGMPRSPTMLTLPNIAAVRPGSPVPTRATRRLLRRPGRGSQLSRRVHQENRRTGTALRFDAEGG